MGAASGSSARSISVVCGRGAYSTRTACAPRLPSRETASDERHGIAQHPHRVANRREEMLVEGIVAQAILARDIGSGQHPYDARDFESGRNVEAHDARVKVGTADHARVMKIRHRDIFGEKRRATDAIPARYGVWEVPPTTDESRMRPVERGKSPRIRAAANSTASMILT